MIGMSFYQNLPVIDLYIIFPKLIMKLKKWRCAYGERNLIIYIWIATKEKLLIHSLVCGDKGKSGTGILL